VNNSVVNAKNRIYSESLKKFCCRICMKSPQAYNLLREPLLLPGRITLWRMRDAAFTKCRLNADMKKLLLKRVNKMTAKEKICILVFDEMSIDEALTHDVRGDFIDGFVDYANGNREASLANETMVFVLRGVFATWKQPICFYFTKSAMSHEVLRTKLIETITVLQEIGLRVVATVCDQSNANCRVSREMTTGDSPSFMVGDQKIIFLFDIPHIFKVWRNNLMKRYFLIDSQAGRVSWRVIEQFFNQHCKGFISSCPKLTEQHIHFNNREQMRVKLATQIFSNSSYAALVTLDSLGQAPEELVEDYKVTAAFLKRMNDLFDCLNTSSRQDSRNPCKVPLRLDNEPMNVIKDALKFFKDCFKFGPYYNPERRVGYPVVCKSTIFSHWFSRAFEPSHLD